MSAIVVHRRAIELRVAGIVEIEIDVQDRPVGELRNVAVGAGTTVVTPGQWGRCIEYRIACAANGEELTCSAEPAGPVIHGIGLERVQAMRSGTGSSRIEGRSQVRLFVNVGSVRIEFVFLA